MTHHSASPTCQKKPCLTKNGMFCRREKQAEQKKNKAKRIEEKHYELKTKSACLLKPHFIPTDHV